MNVLVKIYNLILAVTALLLDISNLSTHIHLHPEIQCLVSCKGPSVFHCHVQSNSGHMSAKEVAYLM